MRFRSLLVACVLPLAATVAVYGCSGDPAPEDLCGWLQNPDKTNCVAEFHEDIGNRCGAADAATVTGTFLKRDALDVCVLSKGGSVVFDPPIDLTHFPTGMPTTMKITNADGSPCGEIMHTSSFSWSLTIPAPPPAMGTTGAGGGAGTTGVGGAEEANEPHYSNGTIAVTSLGGNAIQVTCPAPDIHASNVVTEAESHTFNLNQSLAATTQNGCPQYANIIPQAILEVDPGGVQLAGSIRLRIQYPPEAVKAASTGGAGGSASSTGTGTATSIAPEIVYYYECAVPGAPLICANGLKDASESDVDCGGPESKPNCPVRCAVGQLCVTDCDCDASSLCKPLNGIVQCVADPNVPAPVKGVCSGIICANKVKDTSESDVDCGGVCGATCMDDQSCNQNTDCISNSCTLNVCGPPRCDDLATNGAESDVDCGGTCPNQCADGKKCNSAADCVSGGCSGGVCSACFNMKKDGTESAIDCGGSCAKCGEGKDCTQASDCETNVCTGGKCNGCTDGVKDGKESDIDCGGPFCSKCVDGKTCVAVTDCVSNGCLNGLCSLCGNKVQDQGESDVDCGGSVNPSGETCPRCANGLVCVGDTDCANGTCGITNHCGSCGDGLLNGTESDVDCGAACPTKCPETKICNDHADCAQGVCEKMMIVDADGGTTMSAQGVCNTCTSTKKEGLETDVDCGGPTCAKCVVNQMCKVNLDCMSGVCINSFCK